MTRSDPAARRRPLPALTTAFVLFAACGSPLPPAYVAEHDAATTATARGDHETAAQRWERAAARAPDPRTRDEALYRRAASLERAGQLAAAERAYTELAAGNGERAPRAAFERARLALATGDRDRGYSLLITAVRAFPDSGLAARAAGDYLDHVSRQRGPEAAAHEALRLATELEGREVEERLRYEHAQRLEALRRLPDALAAYLELARRFPYPEGGYWDQALLRAAELERALHRPRRALAHLEALLAERETARITGSYERPAFAQARFRIAEIYRDALRDGARARAEFRRVWSDHPKTLLGDDALFEEALIALGMRDRAGACAAARLLVEREPDSRFARCGMELCPSLAFENERECPAYVRQRITSATGAKAPPPHSSSSSSSSSSSR